MLLWEEIHTKTRLSLMQVLVPVIMIVIMLEYSQFCMKIRKYEIDTFKYMFDFPPVCYWGHC